MLLYRFCWSASCDWFEKTHLSFSTNQTPKQNQLITPVFQRFGSFSYDWFPLDLHISSDWSLLLLWIWCSGLDWKALLDMPINSSTDVDEVIIFLFLTSCSFRLFYFFFVFIRYLLTRYLSCMQAYMFEEQF